MNTAPAWLPGMEPVWFRVDKFDERAIALVDGLLPDGRVLAPHYSRQSPGSNQIAPPGETCLLLGGDGLAVWVACHNFEPGETDTRRWRCTVFRREGGPVASELVRRATAFTYDHWRRFYAWPSVPLETEINIAATAGRRGKRRAVTATARRPAVAEQGDKGIGWCDVTWNPVRGCSRVSEGCRRCYAEAVAGRFSGPGQAYEGLAERRLRVINADEPDRGNRLEGRWTGVVRMVPEHLADPLRWKRPRRVFVNSMSDLFHEKLDDTQIAAVFGVMAMAPQHTFQVLTKRAARMREWFEWIDGGADTPANLCRLHADDALTAAGLSMPERSRLGIMDKPPAWPLPNVWLGTSVENQAAADERIPELLEAPAAVHFLSCEPLLGPVDIAPGLWDGRRGVRWVIAGCESGHGARPAEVAWYRSLRDQCAAAGVAFFLKQAVGASEERREIIDGQAWWNTTRRITQGEGSHRKPGGVIGAPYLDGAQHLAFPAVS